MFFNKKNKLHKNAVELHENAHEYVRMGKVDQALKMFKQVSEIADKINAPELKAHSFINSAQLLAKKNITNHFFICNKTSKLRQIQSRQN